MPIYFRHTGTLLSLLTTHRFYAASLFSRIADLRATRSVPRPPGRLHALVAPLGRLSDRRGVVARLFVAACLGAQVHLLRLFRRAHR